MNELKTLLENFWICKDADKEAYYKVKHDIPIFQKFVREQLGWKLIQTEHLIKLEKIPAHAESFMGIQDFKEIRDYCIFCVVLIFLEDKEEQEQFLLSELVGFVEAKLHTVMEVDWTSFSQRKSLVRVLQFMEKQKMLQVYEGSSDAFGQEASQEVLYENTGYSRYFAVSFARDISANESWQDFEKPQMEELEEDRGQLRINRVYRQLAVCPAMYWESTEDSDSLYLRNQRKWISQNLEDNLGGRLDIHKNAAFWVLEEDEVFGKVHPRDNMLSEAVLIVCAEIQEKIQSGEWKLPAEGYVEVSEEEFGEMLSQCKNKWESAWSKEFREMEQGKYVRMIREFMELWMMTRKAGGIRIYPAVGKLSGYYPKDFQIKGDGTHE